MDRRRFAAVSGVLVAALALGGPAAAAQRGPDTAGVSGIAGAAAVTADHGGDRDRHPERFDYYLALGDSLAQGVQPNAAGQDLPTSQGYASGLAAELRKSNRRLDFVDLGCPGESTTTMIAGGCPFPHTYSNQLSAAVSFLKAHRHARVLVTIDIGSNNVDSCLSAAGIDTACIQAGLQAMTADLPNILGPLKAAAGRHVEFAAMNYYDPFLAAWLDGPAGQQMAVASVQLLGQLNGDLATAYKAYGIPVADVASGFDSTRFTPLVQLTPTLKVPLNVARVCQWTWMCDGPAGPDIHANKLGYEKIEDKLEAVVDR